MMVRLDPVVRDDLRPLFRLKAAADQAGFVAPNEITLAQAPFEPGSAVYAIRAGDVIVGLLALIDFRAHPYLEPHDDPQAAYLWRLLIGQDHQNKGYGRAAMGEFLRMAREGGHPGAMTAAKVDNAVALRFYESLGFRRTGAIADGEVVLRLTL